ncbi:hypothetical protein GE061_010611 [Apolygus lucorum]|uniref:PEST proteolytic signal-containing nuclear protein n=1 Tax=Apolygus lucorum TaxID=248454 RepID=A0A6A4JZM0_APOLU|nr:hypothetical protein GE061_010611 [Apolygus lucorum]
MAKRKSDEMKFAGSGDSERGDDKTKKSGTFSATQISSKKPKLAFSIGKKTSLQEHKEEKLPKPVKTSLREAFNSDTEEEEEMPKEARMKMRNFGRNTPTSSGPNSFGKTRQGFCDAKKLFEKQLKLAADELAD